jgi:Fur family ferric uptake transcriptional regulator
MSCEKVFLEQLRQQGFRLTPQREMILSVMHNIDGFATVEEIYSQVQHRSSSVDISTVYRTLNLLQEFHLVSSVDASDRQRRYELLGIRGTHPHLVCQVCGQVIAINLEVAQEFDERLKAGYGFQAAWDHLTIPGLCQACAASGSG